MSDTSNVHKNTSRTRAGNSRRASASGEEPVGGEEISVGSNTRWPLFIIGGASIVAGIAAIVAPLLAGFAAAITLGICLVFCGAVGVVFAFRERDYWHMAGTFALSVLAVLAGGVMLLQPATGIVALGTLIIAWFGASGILRIYYGVRRWSEPRVGAGWMLALGVASVIVALLLWFAMPYSLIWLPGVILGVDLMIWGSLLVALGWSNA